MMTPDEIKEIRDICTRRYLSWSDPPLYCALEAKGSLLTLLGNALVDSDLSALDLPGICADIRALRRIIYGPNSAVEYTPTCEPPRSSEPRTPSKP